MDREREQGSSKNVEEDKIQTGTKRPYQVKGPASSDEGKDEQLPSGFTKKTKITNNDDDDDPNIFIHSIDIKTKLKKNAVKQTDLSKSLLSVVAQPIICGACGKVDKRNSVVQCCDGHNVCTKCVEDSTKTEFSKAMKGFVNCPQHQCKSSVPQSELRKALPPLMLERLEVSWKEQTIQAVEKMPDTVRCPSCEYPAVLDIHVKRFKCIKCQKEMIVTESEEQAGTSKESNSIHTNNSESFFPKVAHPYVPPAASIVCGACDKEESHSSVIQCCDGHNICTKCVETSMKAELSTVEKGFVCCPKDGCGISIPPSELRKAFSSLVDLLEESWEKQNTEAIEQMNDLVRCPSCKFPAALNIHQKRVRCTQCPEDFCRYCEMKWLEGPSHDLCIKTKKWTSTVTGKIVDIPAHWSESDYNTEGHLMKELSNFTNEVKDVVAYMNTCMPVNVRKVFRIQNERLWEKYSLMRSHMVADLGKLDINERRLFHGTKGNVVEAICKEGFDFRLCGRHRTQGRGLYFAENPRLSHRYSKARPRSQPEPASTNFGGDVPSCNSSIPVSSYNSSSNDSSNTTGSSVPCSEAKGTSTDDYFMFLARVLVGRSCVGSSNLKRPERDSQGRETHSAVNNKHTVFVIFDNTQCYPEFLIQYSVPSKKA